MKYKGTYRLLTCYDIETNQFPRKLDGTFEDVDVYIACYNKIQIFHYGRGILQSYIPSIGRGRNIIKAIKEDLGEDVIFDIEESDSEVLFKFHSKYIKELEPYLKPRTSGSGISPFSTKNLPKSKYNIPDEDLVAYKNITQNIPQNLKLNIGHTTKDFLQSLTNKKNTWEDIRTDMTLKGLKCKEYIHNLGNETWDKYITYLKEKL